MAFIVVSRGVAGSGPSPTATRAMRPDLVSLVRIFVEIMVPTFLERIDLALTL